MKTATCGSPLDSHRHSQDKVATASTLAQRQAGGSRQRVAATCCCYLFLGRGREWQRKLEDEYGVR
ncbi:hypothetical protein Dimus_020624, partial [Dionaea muscipula]